MLRFIDSLLILAMLAAAAIACTLAGRSTGDAAPPDRSLYL